MANPRQKAEANSVFCSLKSSGIRPVVPVTIQFKKKQESTLKFCDSGASLSFIDKTLAEKLNACSDENDMNMTGFHGTNDMKCKQLTMGIRGYFKSKTHHKTVYTHPNIDALTKIYIYREFKRACPQKNEKPERMVSLGQWKRTLGWTFCGPLLPQKAVQMAAS